MEKTLLQLFGIGAFDSSAVRGKSYAEKEQWTSPDKAIMVVQSSFVMNILKTIN